MADASAFQELQNSSKLSSHLEKEERMDENPNMVERKDIEIDSDEDDIIGNRGIHCRNYFIVLKNLYRKTIFLHFSELCVGWMNMTMF